MDIQNKKVVVVTHRSIMPCIPGDDLKNFLLKSGCSNLLYIRHPLLLLQESYELTSDGEHFKTGVSTTFKSFHWKLPESLHYIKDFIYTLAWTLSTKEKYDIYFGINNLNAICGLVLKKLGRVNKVIYYTIDLYPERFPNKFINSIYHLLDKVCVERSDETWNVSPYLEKYRENRGMKGKAFSRQVTVPIGIWYDEVKRVPNSKVKQAKIAYVGHLKAFYGLDLAISALPQVKKKIPEAYLDIIGGGEQQEELVALAKQLGVEKSVNFFGWKEKKEAEGLIADAAIGLAPFNTLIIDEKVKNGDPAKIKDYLALGIPIVMTNASLNAQAIAKARCGVVIDKYDTKLYAEAIIKLLSNKKLREEYRNNALAFVKQFDWNSLFSKNISRLVQ